jgi:hypothetical protein
MKKLTMFALFMFAACGNSSSGKPDARVIIEPPDAAVGPDSTPAIQPDADCFINPTTSDQIMNACTTATSFSPHPTLPLLLDDGGVPALQ